MKTWQKTLVIALGVYVGLALLTASIVGFWLTHAGWACVRVTSSETTPASIAVVVPMAVAEAGIKVAGHGPAAAELRANLGEVKDLLPALEQLAEGLEEMPEGVLVNVHQNGDHVVIQKLGSKIRVEVESANGDHVRVEAPDQAPRRLIRQLRQVVSDRS